MAKSKGCDCGTPFVLHTRDHPECSLSNAIRNTNSTPVNAISETSGMNEKWEYQVYKYGEKLFGGSGKSEDELDSLGRQGWEAVNFAFRILAGSTSGMEILLKRRTE